MRTRSHTVCRSWQSRRKKPEAVEGRKGLQPASSCASWPREPGTTSAKVKKRRFASARSRSPTAFCLTSPVLFRCLAGSESGTGTRRETELALILIGGSWTLSVSEQWGSESRRSGSTTSIRSSLGWGIETNRGSSWRCSGGARATRVSTRFICSTLLVRQLAWELRLVAPLKAVKPLRVGQGPRTSSMGVLSLRRTSSRPLLPKRSRISLTFGLPCFPGRA